MSESLGPAAIDAVVRILVDEYPLLQAVYVYGSAASAQPETGSDVDIGVLLPASLSRSTGSLSMSGARFRLEDALRRPVDLVSCRAVPVVLQKEIVARGVCVYCGHRVAVEEYEMLVLSLYGRLNEERRGILEDFVATRKAYNV